MILCAIVNTIIALALADIPFTIALAWVLAPTVGGSYLLGYLTNFSIWAVVFGAFIGFASTPLFVPRAKTAEQTSVKPISP
jgi:hypothetical protein